MGIPALSLRICLVTLLATAAPAHADLAVLQYHHISDQTPASTSTRPALFKAQLEMIEQLNLTVVPLYTGTQQALAGNLADREQVAITFDDAYDSVWHEAAPILLEKNYPFTVFVNTGAVGRRDYMTWPQLQELAAKQGVSIANHSEDHGHLAQKQGESNEAWQSRIAASLDHAQATLIKKLKTIEPMLAYPYGEFDDKLENAVADRQWLGFGQQSGPIGASSSPTRLPRFPMATKFGQLDALKNKLLSKALPVDPGTLPSGVMQENPPALTLDLPDTLTPDRLTCFASGQGKIDDSRRQDQRVVVQAAQPFDSRRFRYNCTYPAGNDRYFWLSHQWLDLSQPED
ncbi:polysaccharide deacetylase family protein [Marinobacter caseinilyticus]|uniref:polysaccharide deacetylase family protein n=1 Tax=Marinobacter caseinilyticus TaxID=2692195 RepID=UPI00140A1645|nr:polysaccharide deacetylase family protein [Marinobacter caseinilyticus]